MYKNKTYTISPSVMLQHIDDESLLMDANTKLFYELNDMGSVLWETLQHHTNFDGVVKEMLQNYDVSQEQLQNDLMLFSKEPIEKEMIIINEEC
ncbi:PqqD family protein [Sulfurimonas sp. SAG-AH-194-C21]|nr:PqqD family protein [Sulfurimonas sp. SAG-AH-194-C21]MDF1884373.1 PqqD family protein [Sulfurimonas sp. SAG-AH-194-C21]